MFELVIELDREDEITRQIADGIDDALAKTVTDVEAFGKLNITDVDAVDTGAARASIHTDTPQSHGYSQATAEAMALASSPGAKSGKPHESIDFFPELRAGEHEAIAAVGVDYGEDIDKGNGRMEARPFWDDAVREGTKGIVAISEKHINKRLRP